MIKYIKDSIAELNNVTWPTRKQGIKLTTIVFIFMIVSAFALGIVDAIFSRSIQALLTLAV